MFCYIKDALTLIETLNITFNTTWWNVLVCLYVIILWHNSCFINNINGTNLSALYKHFDNTTGMPKYLKILNLFTNLGAYQAKQNKTKSVAKSEKSIRSLMREIYNSIM